MILAEGMERRKLLHAVYEVFSPNDGEVGLLFTTT